MKSALLNILFFLHCLVLTGQTKSFLQDIKQDSAIDLYLTLNWKSIERHKKDQTYLPAQVKLQTPQGDSLNLDLKVRTRGHMRLDICSYPPIKLKFDKSGLAQHSLSSLNELDLVHHCQDGDQYNQYLLREYMCYKIFELVSPYHFHAQLVQLHYENPAGAEAHETSYAFLVENPEELVDRLQSKLNKNKIVTSAAVEKLSFLKMCLFEFMIGNTDWYVPLRHNLEFIGVPGFKLLVAVPYDFDYSGLVDAPYAAHHESLKLPSVTIRYYQGWCQTEDEVNDAIKIFEDQKEKILSMCDHIQGFSERSKKYTREYLQDFFDIIENPRKLENQIIKHCDMWPTK
ncbi:MAG: hypothetical protein ABJB16_02585 [Saprospiraceae bacterium]